MNDREEHHPCPGPAVVAVELGAGRVSVALAPESGPETMPGAGEDGAVPGEVRVTVAHDPTATPGWVDGLAGVLGWLDRRFGTPDPDAPRGVADPDVGADDRAARAVAATTVDWDAATRTLTVRSPRERDLRTVPLAVTVHAPDTSALRVHAGAAPVEATGRTGDVDVTTTGPITLEDLGGRATLSCGAGDVRVRRTTARLRINGGAGSVDVGRVLGPIEITTGAGSVHLGRVGADTAVRVAGGDVTVDDASSGDLELSTGAGSLRVGVHPGVDARVDLRAAAGKATSDLPVARVAPTEEAPLRIRGRTAAGNATVRASRV